MEKIIIGSNEIHSVEKSYVRVVNDIFTFVKPTPPTNIISNKTILVQYITEYGLKVFVKKVEDAVQKKHSSFIIVELSNLRNPKTSVMNSKEIL